ncbi:MULTISPECIES: PQQ-binding-like beta-propeller repeat protein [unclassified Arcicella]|uniref:outer membrane protein assembly factor BamB family protein n=1 Tax=unclassified Arcicella TaxID=2644986 RepID=UPI002857E598|nr:MULTISPECIES: PQQ-binding-like beta-propeller repeat protein [unclassified Arcicella]MDR6563971.1 outer membrane protein assembly factor BamB [Arcicella sp. BE51]MDR6813724.1 outer membrane protein assembly factor BamB [Arcicella sp. BE140]MDR6825036.1 outer membrane protein assembly factor BamB [Arcicella sp. BE139]
MILLVACKEELTVSLSTEKAITKFSFSGLTPVVDATIDEANKKITAVVPPATDITQLTPSITVSDKAMVSPASGKVQDFSREVAYTVTAEDGSKAIYKVLISRTKFTGKDILSFSFNDLSPVVTATIDPVTKIITATVPATADLSKLKVTTTLSERASIVPASGTILDFSKPVSFTVTAEDGTTQVYTANIQQQIVTTIKDNKTVFISNINGDAYAIDAETGELKWKVSIGSGTSNSPILDNGVVYFSDRYVLYALDAETGQQKWQFKDDINSIGSTPLIANGLIYVGVATKMVALDALTGKKKWEFETDYNIRASPCIENGTLLVGTSSFPMVGVDLHTGSLYALDAITGAKKWKFDVKTPVTKNPCVVNGIVCVCGRSLISTSYIYAINVNTGVSIWEQSKYTAISSPTVLNNGLYFSGQEYYVLNTNDGSLKFKYNNTKFSISYSSTSSPMIYDGLIYVGASDRNLYAFSATDGKIAWELQTGDYISSSPCVANGVVYVGGQDGKLYAVDSKTGKIIWSFETSYEIQSSPCVMDKKGKGYHTGESGFVN